MLRTVADYMLLTTGVPRPSILPVLIKRQGQARVIRVPATTPSAPPRSVSDVASGELRLPFAFRKANRMVRIAGPFVQ